MSINYILIATAEPKSVFLELLFKYLKSKKSKFKNKKIVLVGSKKIILKEAKINNYRKKFNQINKINDAKKKQMNLINIKNENRSPNDLISKSFKKCFDILKKNKDVALFNGPIEKKSFLKKKYLGVTEYLAKNTNSKNQVMLIYNKKLSVSPITTHLPIKYVSKHITKIKIKKNIEMIYNFYKKKLMIKPKIAVLGLNPHCETVEKIGEEERIIIPAISELKKQNISVAGPFSADSFFIKKNINKYDVVVGMYHDQVLTPLKTLYNFNAINITIGLPFVRVSPDHGPNISMYGKNKSDPSSIFCAMDFFNKI